jgi:hypothetical protein
MADEIRNGDPKVRVVRLLGHRDVNSLAILTP